MASITNGQLVRLQVLYSQMARHTQESASRDDRLAWASSTLGRPISSFRDLTLADARQLIDGLQGQLGVKAPLKNRRPRTEARRHGKDGRHDGAEFAATPQIAGAADLQTIEEYYTRLQWTRAMFDTWLRSPRSPLTSKSNPQIRTVADANRVRWALKRMLVHRGLWEDRNAG